MPTYALILHNMWIHLSTEATFTFACICLTHHNLYYIPLIPHNFCFHQNREFHINYDDVYIGIYIIKMLSAWLPRFPAATLKLSTFDWASRRLRDACERTMPSVKTTGWRYNPFGYHDRNTSQEMSCLFLLAILFKMESNNLSSA